MARVSLRYGHECKCRDYLVSPRPLSLVFASALPRWLTRAVSPCASAPCSSSTSFSRDSSSPYECRVRFTLHTRRPQHTPDVARKDARSHAIVATTARLQQRPLTCSGRLQRHPLKPPLSRSMRACAALEHCWHLQAVLVDSPEPLTVATSLRSGRRGRLAEGQFATIACPGNIATAHATKAAVPQGGPPAAPFGPGRVHRAEGPARAPVPSPAPRYPQTVPGPGMHCMWTDRIKNSLNAPRGAANARNLVKWS